MKNTIIDVSIIEGGYSEVIHIARLSKNKECIKPHLYGFHIFDFISYVKENIGFEGRDEFHEDTYREMLGVSGFLCDNYFYFLGTRDGIESN